MLVQENYHPVISNLEYFILYEALSSHLIHEHTLSSVQCLRHNTLVQYLIQECQQVLSEQCTGVFEQLIWNPEIHIINTLVFNLQGITIPPNGGPLGPGNISIQFSIIHPLKCRGKVTF